MNLSIDEQKRYARHLSLPHVGIKGQEKLKDAKVLVVGAGGLGSPVLLYLAAAGVGTIGIVDNDTIDESNLQRQILYETSQKGTKKTTQAKKRIEALNALIKVITHDEQLTKNNALQILKEYDIIIDGTDNFPARFLINDACLKLDKPFVFGAIHQFEGHVSLFNYHNGPCYRCLFPQPPPPDLVPSCEEAGVLGVLPGIIGTIQATEALKIILGIGTTLSARLLVFDALSMTFRELHPKKNPRCRACSDKDSIELVDYKQACEVDEEKTAMSVQELSQMMESKKEIILMDVREPFERDICKLDDTLHYSFRKIQNGDESFLKKLKKDVPIIVYCHTGRRSGIVVDYLREKGYCAINLSGGIHAWAKEINTDMAIY